MLTFLEGRRDSFLTHILSLKFCSFYVQVGVICSQGIKLPLLNQLQISVIAEDAFIWQIIGLITMTEKSLFVDYEYVL